jgi:predicted transcriptional regulator
MYGMTHKTTVYLPDDLKSAIEREALRRGCSEAQVIRDAVTDAVSRPRPRAGLLDGEPLAERVDVLLVGFGDR